MEKILTLTIDTPVPLVYSSTDRLISSSLSYNIDPTDNIGSIIGSTSNISLINKDGHFDELINSGVVLNNARVSVTAKFGDNAPKLIFVGFIKDYKLDDSRLSLSIKDQTELLLKTRVDGIALYGNFVDREIVVKNNIIEKSFPVTFSNDKSGAFFIPGDAQRNVILPRGTTNEQYFTLSGQLNYFFQPGNVPQRIEYSNGTILRLNLPSNFESLRGEKNYILGKKQDGSDFAIYINPGLKPGLKTRISISDTQINRFFNGNTAIFQVDAPSGVSYRTALINSDILRDRGVDIGSSLPAGNSLKRNAINIVDIPSVAVDRNDFDGNGGRLTYSVNNGLGAIEERSINFTATDANALAVFISRRDLPIAATASGTVTRIHLKSDDVRNIGVSISDVKIERFVGVSDRLINITQSLYREAREDLLKRISENMDTDITTSYTDDSTFFTIEAISGVTTLTNENYKYDRRFFQVEVQAAADQDSFDYSPEAELQSEFGDDIDLIEVELASSFDQVSVDEALVGAISSAGYACYPNRYIGITPRLPADFLQGSESNASIEAIAKHNEPNVSTNTLGRTFSYIVFSGEDGLPPENIVSYTTQGNLTLNTLTEQVYDVLDLRTEDGAVVEYILDSSGSINSSRVVEEEFVLSGALALVKQITPVRGNNDILRTVTGVEQSFLQELRAGDVIIMKDSNQIEHEVPVLYIVDDNNFLIDNLGTEVSAINPVVRRYKQLGTSPNITLTATINGENLHKAPDIMLDILVKVLTELAHTHQDIDLTVDGVQPSGLPRGSNTNFVVSSGETYAALVRRLGQSGLITPVIGVNSFKLINPVYASFNKIDVVLADIDVRKNIKTQFRSNTYERAVFTYSNRQESTNVLINDKNIGTAELNMETTERPELEIDLYTRLLKSPRYYVRYFG